MLDRLRLMWRLWTAWDDAIEQATKETPMQNGKPFYQSKTFWVALGLSLLDLAQQTNAIDIVPAPVLTQVAAVAMVVLRLVTKQPVALPGAKS